MSMKLKAYERRAKNRVKDNTLESRMSGLRQFDDFLDHDEEPTVEDAEEYADWLLEQYEAGVYSSATVRQYYKCVRYYFSTMMGNEDELDHISQWLPEESNDHGDYLDFDEWDLLRKNAYAYREDAIIELMYRYGRRPGEVRLINLDDVDLDKEQITFNILKKDKPLRATFELMEEPKRKIEKYLEYRIDQEIEAEHPWEEGTVEPLFTTGNGRISYDTIWVNVKKIADRAGIDKNITPKSMRHSRATHLDWEGNSPEEIARHQLIHEPDTKVIGAYIHDREEEQVREPMKMGDE